MRCDPERSRDIVAYQLLDDTVKWIMFDRLYGFIIIKH